MARISAARGPNGAILRYAEVDEDAARALLPDLEAHLGPSNRMLQELDGSLSPDASGGSTTLSNPCGHTRIPSACVVVAEL